MSDGSVLITGGTGFIASHLARKNEPTARCIMALCFHSRLLLGA
ncbi:MAG: hypothetical protein ACFFEE_07035 [Candidatus Thorarchaeota archaeon]